MQIGIASEREEKKEAKESKLIPEIAPQIIQFLRYHGDFDHAPEIFKQIIEAKRFDINATDAKGRNLTFHLTNKAITNRFDVNVKMQTPNLQYGKVLLAAKANPSLPDKEGITPLMAYDGEHEVVELLLEHGADFKALDSKKKTAAEMQFDKTRFKIKSDVEFLKLHLRPWLQLAKKDVAAGTKDQIYASWTALHLAVIMEDHDFLEASCSPASLDKPDFNGNTPLMLAFIAGNFKAARFLMSKGASTSLVNHKKQDLFHLAFVSAIPQTMDLIHLAINNTDQSKKVIFSKLTAGDTDNFTPMEHLFNSNWQDEKLNAIRYQATELLLKLGDNPYEKAIKNPLAEAVYCKDMKLTTLLLNPKAVQHPIKVNQETRKSNLALFNALLGPVEFVALLLKQGADPKVGQNTNSIRGTPNALIHLIHNLQHCPDHIAKLKLMLDVTVKEKNDTSLLDEPDSLDHLAKGYTPLDYFASREIDARSLEIMRILLEYGASPDSSVYNGYWRTPLHNAINDQDRTLQNKFPAIQLLIEYKAWVNATNAFQATPLMYAAGLRFYQSRGTYKQNHRQGQIKTVLFLLEKGACVGSKDNTGKTAVDYANESNSTIVLEILNKALALETAGKSVSESPGSFEMYKSFLTHDFEWDDFSAVETLAQIEKQSPDATKTIRDENAGIIKEKGEYTNSWMVEDTITRTVICVHPGGVRTEEIVSFPAETPEEIVNLLKAAADGDINRIKDSLGWHVDVNSSYNGAKFPFGSPLFPRGWTALMCAAKRGQHKAVEFLLENKAKADITARKEYEAGITCALTLAEEYWAFWLKELTRDDEPSVNDEKYVASYERCIALLQPATLKSSLFKWSMFKPAETKGVIAIPAKITSASGRGTFEPMACESADELETTLVLKQKQPSIRELLKPFWEVGLSEPEKRGLKKDKNYEFIKAKIPAGYEVGAALDRGDCFFDSVAQALIEAKKTIAGDTIQGGCKQLRLLCHRYIRDLDLTPDKNWVKQHMDRNATSGMETDKFSYCYEYIQYTQPEMDKFIDPKTGLSKLSTWGRPQIEGKIICKELKIRIHVIEFVEFEGNITEVHQLVDEQGLKDVGEDEINWKDPDTVHVINYRGHFMPLTRSTVPELSKTATPLLEFRPGFG